MAESNGDHVRMMEQIGDVGGRVGSLETRVGEIAVDVAVLKDGMSRAALIGDMTGERVVTIAAQYDKLYEAIQSTASGVSRIEAGCAPCQVLIEKHDVRLSEGREAMESLRAKDLQLDHQIDLAVANVEEHYIRPLREKQIKWTGGAVALLLLMTIILNLGNIMKLFAGH